MRRREAIAGMLATLGANPAHGQPALDELRSDARKAGFDLSHAELAAIQTYVSDFQSAAERVANAIPPAAPPKYVTTSIAGDERVESAGGVHSIDRCNGGGATAGFGRRRSRANRFAKASA